MSSERYRSPHGEVEAIHWVGPEKSAEVFNFTGWRYPDDVRWRRFCAVAFATGGEDDERYSWGDWIVKDADGQFQPVKPETFAADYEALS